MGWCSATQIFDSLAEIVLKTDILDEVRYDVLHQLAEVLEDGDWDCQNDSRYFNDPVVQKVFKDLHPTWFEE